MFQGGKHSQALVYLTPNDVSLLQSIRKYLNREYFTLSVRARHHNRQNLHDKGLARKTFTGHVDVPIAYAEQLAVYVKYKREYVPIWCTFWYDTTLDCGRRVSQIPEHTPVFYSDNADFTSALLDNINTKVYDVAIEDGMVFVTRKPEFISEYMSKNPTVL